MEEWEVNICEGCGMKSNIGGKRERAGRPAPLGRKKTTIRNLQARIIYAQHDGNHAEVLRLKKELEKVK
jgi:hypothetical protein